MSDPAQLARARDASRGLTRKVIVGTLLGGLVFVALALYADLDALREAMRSFDTRAFAIALALATGNYALRYARWHFYLRRLAIEIPHVHSALVFLSGFVMSVTPGKLGEVFKSLLLYESHGVPIARSAPVVVAERITDLIALVALTALGCLAFERGVEIALVGAVGVALMIVALLWRGLGNAVLVLVGKLPLLRRITPQLRDAYESLYALCTPKTLTIATALSILSWGLECAALWVLLRALPGGGLPWDASVFAYSSSTIAGALAMMPGGLGVTEASMTGLIETLGHGAITTAAASAATILTRLATLWWAVLLGALALIALRARARRSAPDQNP